MTDQAKQKQKSTGQQPSLSCVPFVTHETSCSSLQNTTITCTDSSWQEWNSTGGQTPCEDVDMSLIGRFIPKSEGMGF